MKNRALFFAFLLPALATMVLAGCDPTFNTDGRKVKFTAVSKSALATKTAYTRQGQTGGQTYQTIAWNEGDKIRIFCPKVEGEVYSYNDGTATYTETDPRFSLDYMYADYTVQQIDNSDFPKSKASLANVDPNGLIWAGTQDATFYAAYPYDTKICSNISSQLRFAVEVPVGNYGSSASGLQTGDSTFVKNLSLLAIQKDVNNGDQVNLDFYPAFSAFEFVLNSADETNLTIDWFELFTDTEATNEFLTGLCYYDLNALSGSNHFLPNSALSFDDGGKSIKVNVNKTASATTAASFTLFALPCTFNQLSIRVAFTPAGGSQMTKTLKLKQNNDWISFPAGHKARIHGLALEGGKKWQLIIKTDVKDWTYISEDTTFSEQIGITKDPDPIEGETETGNHYADSLGVVEGAPGYPTGYAKYYQIRTLDMSRTNPHFVMKFTPFAPIGGYWRLVPQGIGAGSLQHFDVRLYLGEGEYSDDLTGQILSQEVEIHIFPKDFDPEAGESYAMILRCYFCAQKDFDDAFSADSEFQDVHGDGRYSYWRFTLPSSN